MDARQIIENELENIYNLECDGATRVLHYVLSKNDIPHEVYIGSVLKNGEIVIPLHYWIVLDIDKTIVDYKCQMWVDDTNAPNGIFKPEQYPEYSYEGQTTELPMNETLYRILTS